MMTMAYSVYDSKAECFGTPFFFPTRGAALRAFTDLVNDNRSTVNKHPMDYALFEIGNFNDSNGVLEKIAQVNLGVASSYKIKADVIQPEIPAIAELGV